MHSCNNTELYCRTAGWYFPICHNNCAIRGTPKTKWTLVHISFTHPTLTRIVKKTNFFSSYGLWPEVIHCRHCLVWQALLSNRTIRFQINQFAIVSCRNAYVAQQWPKCQFIVCMDSHATCLRLRNDLYCVEWGVKLYSLTHPMPHVLRMPSLYGYNRRTRYYTFTFWLNKN